MTAPQTTATTDLQSLSAALQQRLDAALLEKAALAERLAARDAALAQRNSEYGARIEHQAATIDVLKVMSASPGDPQPVFDLITRRARELCNGVIVTLYEFDGDMVHIRSASFVIDPAMFQAVRAKYPMRPTRGTIGSRTILEKRVIHIRDADLDAELWPEIRDTTKTILGLPLLLDDVPIGAITLNGYEAGGFSDSQVALLQTFAEQAVIAITSAETYRALQTRTSDLQESLEYQTATSEVLKVISRSTFDLQPVLDTVVETAAQLCDADQAVIIRRDGEAWRFAVNFGFPPEYEAYLKALGPVKLDADSPTVAHRTAIEGRPVHIDDVAAVSGYPEALIRLGKQRTSLGVPLLRGGETIGVIQLSRQRVEPFTDRQIELVSIFGDQAVIAIENTRLITEQREALEQQTATAEVLQVINASPGDLTPVFNIVLQKATKLCMASYGELGTYDGTEVHFRSSVGLSPEAAARRQGYAVRPEPGTIFWRLLNGEKVVHIDDLMEDDAYPAGMPSRRFLVHEFGMRASLAVGLRKDEELIGAILIHRTIPGSFSERQISLLENFAAQAVIAMENARLLDEIRQRQDELRVTFENMGDGVAMFDETPRLVAWNRKFQDILDLPDGVLAERLTFPDYIRYLTERGEYGAGANPEEQIRHLTGQAGEVSAYERTRPDGRVIGIRRNPVAGGGFVLIFSDITERKRNEAEIHAARDAAEEASRTIEAAYRDLKAAQANLIQAEKMASLGQLTAGIAHEIKNPLNFVNNFSALSAELIDELREVLTPQPLGDTVRAEVDDLTALLKGNLEKVVQHGQRADGIVKAMLEHSRGSSAERRMVYLNAVIDEALNLGYHGARAQDQSFNITLKRDFGEGMAPIEVNPQDMTRVFLNIFSNGFYAATRRARSGGDAGFVPMLKVTTRDAGEVVEIRVRDNGTGIPADIRDKLFQPFFTTKPTGEGTGLGLSITYDIVTKQHGGTITVDSEVDAFTEFVITLPRRMFATEEDRA